MNQKYNRADRPQNKQLSNQSSLSVFSQRKRTIDASAMERQNQSPSKFTSYSKNEIYDDKKNKNIS